MRVITAGEVLLGPPAQRIVDGAVVIGHDTIIDVGPRAEVEQRLTTTVERHHFPNSTVLPGLINAHVHCAFDTSLDPVDSLQASDDQTLLLGMAGRAQQLLFSGVTTARDLGDRGGLAIRLRDAVARGDLLGPRLLTAGAPLTTPAGHCWFFGGEVAGESQIRERIQLTADTGADLIKVMASGGQLTPHSPPMWKSQFSTEELCIIVDEAKRAGLSVAAHAHGTDAIVSAVKAGVRTVEHCTWMGPDGIDRREHVARKMAEDGIYVCSTSSRNWRTIIANMGAQRIDEIYGRLTWMDDRGIPLITGTDAGLPRSVFDDFVGALELYEYLGFSLHRIIEMATTTSAAALGLGDHVGYLGPEYSADLLVVDRLTDSLAPLRTPQMIVAQGRIV